MVTGTSAGVELSATQSCLGHVYGHGIQALGWEYFKLKTATKLGVIKAFRESLNDTYCDIKGADLKV